MRTGAKVMIILLVSLPMAAYVLGTLAAAPPDPAPRAPVIITEMGNSGSAPSPSTRGTDTPPEPQRDDDVRVVNPSPTRVGEDDDVRDDGNDEDGEPEGDDRTDDDTGSGDD